MYQPTVRRTRAAGLLWALATSLLLLTATAMAKEPATPTGTLVVTLDNLPSEQIVHIGLWDSAEGFLEDGETRQTRKKATAGSVVWTIENLPYGTYAVAAWQDLNGNGKQDTNFLGAPVEPIGVTNNAEGHFGPPAYDDAEIRFAQPRMTVSFRLACPLGCLDAEEGDG